ncbi:hypothetical protein NDN08_007102 [Rhodosorus marinus]|uniref:ASPIC/UnbV domain-containing protein n=1 Tax=Rhodosorus marinus TaxID=101924 RepID=A0AAV8UJM0_9RHOD|nr:hypothetical protein NDN08_007102 [Rhodosorus marinus]
MRLVFVVLLVLVAASEAALRPKFADVSASRGIQTLSENHRRRPEGSKYDGATIADLDCDGRYDLILSNHGNNAEWYWSKGHNMFESMDPRLYMHDVHGTAAGDLDDDGIMDVVFTIGGSGGQKPGVPIYYSVKKNHTWKRDAGFKYGFGNELMRGRTAAFVDLNHDGKLDLMFINQQKLDGGRKNYVYQNLGNGKFRLRENTGLEMRPGFTNTIVDINNDGNIDILVFMIERVDVYLGTGGFKFIKNNKILPNINMRLVTSIVEFDYDRDGDFDLYMTRGYPGVYNMPNILLENRNGIFVDVSNSTGVNILGHNRHATFADFNNDGWDDLYVTFTTDYKKRRMQDLMLLNNGGKFFTKTRNVGTQSKNPWEDGNNSIAFDFDNDGKPDILSGNRNSTWNLYRNTTPKGNRHYIIVRVGRPACASMNPKMDRSPMYAVVKVVTPGGIFMKRVSTPGRSHSQACMETLHFGLGTQTKVLRIIVEYMGGVTVIREIGIQVDKIITIGKVCKCPKGTNGPNCKLPAPVCGWKRCAGRRCERGFLNGNRRLIYYCVVGRKVP